MLDEVGDDQEVARVIHAGDDIELERQPRGVIFFRRALREPVHLEAIAQALLGLAAQFRGLFGRGIRRIGAGADSKARQNGFARHRPERAALGDLDR